MTSSVDLWPPDLVVSEETSPALVLREQADALRKRTNGRVEARIYTRPEQGGKVSHYFDLQTPEPGGYSHRLLEVVHRKSQLYPAEVNFILAVNDEGQAPYYKCSNQEELEHDLRGIFADEQTRKMINSLLVA